MIVYDWQRNMATGLSEDKMVIILEFLQSTIFGPNSSSNAINWICRKRSDSIKSKLKVSLFVFKTFIGSVHLIRASTTSRLFAISWKYPKFVLHYVETFVDALCKETLELGKLRARDWWVSNCIQITDTFYSYPGTGISSISFLNTIKR